MADNTVFKTKSNGIINNDYHKNRTNKHTAAEQYRLRSSKAWDRRKTYNTQPPLKSYFEITRCPTRGTTDLLPIT